MKANPPKAKNRTITRIVGHIIPSSADTTPCAPPIIAATISPIGPKNIPNMAQRQPWPSFTPSFVSFIAHLPSAPQISRIDLLRRLHSRLCPLLLLHCGKSSSFHKSHVFFSSKTNVVQPRDSIMGASVKTHHYAFLCGSLTTQASIHS